MIIAIALGMAYKRYAKNERGYAGAWLLCAIVNALLLVELWRIGPGH